MTGTFRALRAFEDSCWTRAFFRWLGIALALHILAAIFSVGYYHTDEHFQVLEFLAFKLGKAPASELAVEFQEKLRPWFQPWLDFGIVRILRALGINSPFQWAFLFRFYSALLGWLSLAGLAILSYSWFESAALKRLALILSGTLWYLPALHARHSSENMSGSAFYIGASLLFIFVESESLLFHYAVGLIFGAAFLFRYQTGFLVLGALAYYVLRYRPRFAKLALLACGILTLIAVGVCIDHWGYGAWTFTPWNYFHYNLVLNHVADVDTQPVWDFFRSSLTETFPPLGFLTLCAFVLSWVFVPLHLLTAITFPLYLVHSAIGHKELRFIFPIAHAGPFLLLLSCTARHKAGEQWRKLCSSRGGVVVLKALFAVNLIALVPTTLLPCWMPARFYSELYAIKTRELPRELMQILYIGKDPLEILGIPLNFYRPPDTISTAIPDYGALNRLIASSSRPVWYFEVGFELPPSAGAAREACHPAAHSLPKLIATIVRWEPVQPLTKRVTDWTLYRCTAPVHSGTAGALQS